MQNIQEIFNQIKSLQTEQKEIKREYRDALSHDIEYAGITEKLKELREKKKKFEGFVQGQMGKRYERLEEINAEVTDMRQMLSDIAMTTLMRGESIIIKDEYDNLYEPLYTVNFRKTSAKAESEEEEKKEISA